MGRTIFVNLPVADVTRSTAFYEAIGLVRDGHLSSAQGSCLRWSDEIAVMVTERSFFETLAHRAAGDPRTASTAAFALVFDGRAEVDAIVEQAIAAGGREVHPPEDLGFMYSRAFEDPDGHAFGPMWMDAAAAPAQPGSDDAAEAGGHGG